MEEQSHRRMCLLGNRAGDAIPGAVRVSGQAAVCASTSIHVTGGIGLGPQQKQTQHRAVAVDIKEERGHWQWTEFSLSPYTYISHSYVIISVNIHLHTYSYSRTDDGTLTYFGFPQDLKYFYRHLYAGRTKVLA